MDRINEYIENQLDFEFEFEIDLFGKETIKKNIKKWKKKIGSIFSKK